MAEIDTVLLCVRTPTVEIRGLHTHEEEEEDVDDDGQLQIAPSLVASTEQRAREYEFEFPADFSLDMVVDILNEC